MKGRLLPPNYSCNNLGKPTSPEACRGHFPLNLKRPFAKMPGFNDTENCLKEPVIFFHNPRTAASSKMKPPRRHWADRLFDRPRRQR